MTDALFNAQDLTNGFLEPAGGAVLIVGNVAWVLLAARIQRAKTPS